jgi:hypothetical protein
MHKLQQKQQKKTTETMDQKDKRHDEEKLAVLTGFQPELRNYISRTSHNSEELSRNKMNT